jgi:hypothetical protein
MDSENEISCKIIKSPASGNIAKMELYGFIKYLFKILRDKAHSKASKIEITIDPLLKYKNCVMKSPAIQDNPPGLSKYCSK